MRTLAGILCCLITIALQAQTANLAGTWEGTHSSTYVYCSAKPTTTGTAKLVVAQQVNDVEGTFAWEALATHNCFLTERETITFRIAGQASGGTLTAKVFYVDDPSKPQGDEVGAMKANAVGAAMTFEVTIFTAPEDIPEDGPIQTIISGQLTRATPKPQPNANVVISSFPSGMIQNVGEATATDAFSLTNTGDAAAEVLLETSEDFFTLPVTKLILAPGETQRIGIRAVAQSVAGARTGTITVHGAGLSSIRVSLLTGNRNVGANRPSGPIARTEVVAPPERLLVDGTVCFTNGGTITLLAIAVSDVPWIIPQSGTITLAPGQTVAVPFQIDRSKRPDATALVGGAAGSISLRFVGTSAALSFASHGSTTTNTVSVQIVDVVKPVTGNQAFPPLQPGEVAYFISGLGGRGGKLTDLLLSNRGPAKTTDLRMYFNSFGPGAATKLLNIVQGFEPNVAVTFPSMAKNVFDAIDQVGTLQIRGTSASGMSVAAVQLASVATGRYATALPVLRSDRSAGSGERINLAGVEADGTTQTALYIQEVAGANGGVQVEFVNAVGVPLLPALRPNVLNPFAMVEVAVPPGAALARITVVSSGSARFAAYALVTDDGTADSWVISDITRNSTPPSSLFIVPLLSVDGQAPERNLYLTNNDSSAAIDVTFDQLASSTRRRSTGPGGGTEPAPGTTLTIQPLQTITPPVSPGKGHLRISAPAGSFSASARSTAGTGNGGVYGTGLIAAAANGALKPGETKRITGIDDSDANRSTLILVETAGQSTTVRLTLRYVLASGTKVSAYAVSTRTIALAPRQMTTLDDLAKAIIGSERDAFGDLNNCQLDVEVIGGTGAIVALVQSVDDGTGDVVLRD